MFSNKRLNIGVGLLMVLQFVILSTGLSKFFIVSNINIMCIVTTLCICVLTFVIGELFKPVYAKLFKDY